MENTPLLDDTTRALVKATVPTLSAHGEALTRHFYQRLFSHHPMLKEVFNQGHQHTGSQQQALAAAVLAYAQHIDDPSVLRPALLHIAHKHVSLGIRPEHYPLVGQQLLAAMSDVMGEAATPELLAAWGAAYAQLAEVLIELERTLYAQAAQQAGGWSGARSMRVRRKALKGEAICSFELVPADGGPLPRYRPGQYVSVSQWVPSWGLQQWRQYSLVGAPGGDSLEIGVKRERPQGGCPMGHVSTALHERVQEGDVLAVTAPAGDFVLHEDRSTPLLLLSGGVGITPMMAMLAQLAATRSPRELHFWHACQSPRHQAFAAEVQAHLAQLPNARWRVTFEADAPAEPWAQAGRLNVGDLPVGLLACADVYLCGPLGFMAAQREALLAAGLPSERLHQESFGGR